MKAKHLLSPASLFIVAGLLSLGAIFSNNPAFADLPPSTTQSPSTSSVYADGHSTITISVKDLYDYIHTTSPPPSSGDRCADYLIQLSGTNNILNGTTYVNGIASDTANASDSVNTYYDPSLPVTTYSLTPGYQTYSCSGSYTLSSSTAQTETATLWSDGGKSGPNEMSSTTISLNFAAVPAAASTSATAHHATASTSTAATTPTSAPPVVATPTISQVKVGSQVVPTTQPITVDVGQPLVLSGKTVANGTVTLYIHSKLRTVTVKADKDGVWKYTIVQLPVGSHHIDVQATDPSNKQQSAKASLLDFTVKPSKSLAIAKTASKFNPWASIAVPAIIALAVVAGAFYGWRWYRHRSVNANSHQNSDTPQTDSPQPPEDSETQA